MTTALDITGMQVPDMTLSNSQGDDVRLRDFAGKTLVLYFYAKDSTPGCTTQACELRDHWSEFEQRDGVEVFGVSPQDAKSHTKFRSNHDLPFELLVDADHKLAEAFGIWVEKSFMGRTYMGNERSTVIIGPDGTVRNVLRSVKPKEHVALLGAALDAIDGPTS